MLPKPIGGEHTGSIIGDKARRPGVPLSDPADAPALQDRTYKGSGTFLAEADPASVDRAPRAEGREAGDGVTLALSGASASEAAKIILGDILKVNYTVSDKVQARITLNTPQPVAKDALIGIFESLLRTEGAALLAENGLYKIVPAEEGSSAPLNTAGSARAGLTSEPMPLRYVSASEMERILKSVAPNAKIARVDPARNLLLISGTQAELQSMRETISVFDVDWMRGMSVAIHPLDTPDPDAIAQELDTIFANDRDSPTKGIVRFVPNKRLKSIIVISSRPEYLNKAAGWIKRLDMVGAAVEKQVNVYHVQNRPAAELAQLLQKVYQSQKHSEAPAAPSATTAPGEPAVLLSEPAPSESAPPATSGGSTVGVGQGEPQPLQTFKAQTFVPGTTRTSTGVTSQTAAPGAEGGQAVETGTLKQPSDDRTSGIQVVADEQNNALIVTATAQEYKRVKQILSRIDVAANQVLLEATIAEVTLNDTLKFGLRWFFQSEHNKVALTDNKLADFGNLAVSAATGFSYFLNTSNIKVALNALNDVTDVNIVSSPTMTVMDNKKAILQIGDEVPILTQQTRGQTSADAPLVNQVMYRNTGVVLNITPRVGDDDRVLLDIEQEVSDAITTQTSDIDSPTIQQRRIKTTVSVRNGESIVLAGLMQDRATVTKSQVPLVGDIPVVGSLFKNKSNEIKRTELLIAITPHVLRDASQLNAIASEFRDKLNFSTRPQRQAPPDKRENIDRLLVR